MFLTRDELQELTGFKYPSKQIEWLRAEGFIFRVAADGHPRVLQSAVLKILGGQITEQQRNVGEIHWDKM